MKLQGKRLSIKRLRQIQATLASDKLSAEDPGALGVVSCHSYEVVRDFYSKTREQLARSVVPLKQAMTGESPLESVPGEREGI